MTHKFLIKNEGNCLWIWNRDGFDHNTCCPFLMLRMGRIL